MRDPSAPLLVFRTPGPGGDGRGGRRDSGGV